ncbi:beta-galactosidase GalB [Hymenobacter ginsengisoli]|uniref:Beta-galactosidase GalB n=1 Tax=Hymenobacter ginsengisoli TaxID=1051626 RepID=A0ABP8Q0Q8_9BACT|nr:MULTISPECIES: beta-galactosidase GalB [unclassified Hymenobacter]MBO2030571.1 glycoside hydrolase family 2 protein [Hymenobacter sp. BT559]
MPIHKPLAAALLLATSLSAAAQSRQETLLTTDWKFSKGDQPNGAKPEFNDAKWQTVRVPHDWAITGPFNGQNDAQVVKIEQNGEKEATLKSGRTGGLPFVGVGWYRRTLAVPTLGKNGQAILLFDGAMSNARVFVNGKEAMFWPYGYNSFSVDITPFLRASGTNTLAVRLENQPESSRWYPGAGLYRNVHLITTKGAHVPVWGTYLTTPEVSTSAAKVKLKTQVVAAGAKGLTLQTNLRDASGRVVASATTPVTGAEVEQDFTVASPRLWSPETPTMYTAESKLLAGSAVQDTYKTPFGIRTFKFEKGKGFSLNGQPRKFKGVCNHHDLGPLGTAVNVAALRHQLVLLKGMGCDAIRTSHNMPAPELMTLCDELGFMVMVESFDEWKAPKVKNGYSQYFDQWVEKDLTNMVHRDRNHPSAIMWSIGNEVPDQSTPEGPAIAKRLQDIVHREDPTRPVTMGMDRYDDDFKYGIAAVLDIPGFNYKPHRYADAITKLPQGFLLGSETASTVSSRGVYKFPVELAKNKQYPDNQSSSYDLEYCPWSQIPDIEFAAQDDLPFTLGEFVWTGFDYLGEPTPYDEKWPSHSSYFGIIDLAGQPKDRYYLYRARWNPSQPTVHLLPHWTWPGREGQVTPVFCYTNGTSAELFVNGKSQGRQTKAGTGATDPQTRYRLEWKDVVYQPGSLKVVAYDAQGKAIGTEEVRTAGKPDHIRLVADHSRLAANGEDLAYVTARVEDAQGNLCPEATNQLHFTVSGAGKFRAIGNGDATNLEPFQQPQMHAFQGQLVAIVQASNAAGAVQVKATAPGLKDGITQLTTSK